MFHLLQAKQYFVLLEPQVEHFGRSGKYTILVFDNRGVGNSGTPKGPYS